MVRVRVLAAGLLLLAAGCAVLASGARSTHTSAKAAAPSLTIAPTAGSRSADTQSAPTLLAAATPATASDSPIEAQSAAQSLARSLFAGLPLIFEPNQGQANLDPADRRAQFITRGPGYSLFLGSEGATLSLISRQPVSQQRAKSRDAGLTRVSSLQMKLAGANPTPAISGANLLPGKSNYFLGNDPSKWRAGVPQYSRVLYENIYPGINLVFYGNQGRLEYDFQVAPGSDPKQAELEFNGAQALELKHGALIVSGNGNSVELAAPRIYQEIAGHEQPVEGSFVLRGHNRAGFAIGSYDHSRQLIIDPVVSFSTYFGGSGDERATSVAVDANFNMYLTGSTTSPNLPTTPGLFQTALAPGATQNVYIAKIQPSLGSNSAVLLFVTYLGGNGIDTPAAVAFDGSSNVYVAGTTSSTNFPTTLTNAYQAGPESGTHAFVTEMQADATALLYSSYLAGNGTDSATGMAIDASGYIYVTGTTTSTDTSSGTDQFPASGLPQGVPYQSYSRSPGQPQFFVTKVYPNAPRIQSIAYSTYFGGASFQTATPIAVGGGITVDGTGNVYFTGTTNYTFTGCVGCSNSDFPILNAYQPCLDTPSSTNYTGPPVCTPSATDSEPDAFVAKLNLNPQAPQGQQLVWSTYVGGTGYDAGVGIATDTGQAHVYIVGSTASIDIGSGTNTLSNSAAYQRCLDQPVNPTLGTACNTLTSPYPNDAFVAVLTNPSITTGTTQTNGALSYFSYLGGTNTESGLAIAVDSSNGAVITGSTNSIDFPVYPPGNPIQSTLTGGQDAFVARLNTTAIVGQTTSSSWSSYFGGAATDPTTVLTEGTGVALDNNQNAYFVGDTNSLTLQTNKPYQAANAGGYDAFATQLAPRFSVSIIGILSQGTNQTFISAGNQATFTYTITNNGPDPASNLTLTDDLSQATTITKVALVSASTSSGTCGTGSTSSSVSCSLPPLQVGGTATVTVVLTPQPNPLGGQAQFNGGAVQVISSGNIVQANTTVSATMSDFTISVSPATFTLAQAGNTAHYNVQLSPNPLYANPISLTCTNLPAASACTFTSTPVTLLGPGSSVCNLTTTARPVVTPAMAMPLRLYGLFLALPGITLLGLGRKRSRARLFGACMMFALFALLLLQPACSGSSTQAPVSGTPAGTYYPVISATSGSDTKNQTVTLVVP